MQFGKATIPENLNYAKTHLWVKIQNNVCTLGWTDYIQRNAGDVNYIELPVKGTAVKVNLDFGTIETSKWVDRLYSPINGRVIEVNDGVVHNPEMINKFPFTQGWFIKVELQDGVGAQNLMSPMEYFEYIKVCGEKQDGITGNGQIEHSRCNDPGI